MQTRVLGVALAAAALVGPAAGATEPEKDATADVRGCLALIHDGRFDEADQLAAQLRGQSNGDPAGVFLGAFVAWWRLLYDDRNDKLSKMLEERLERAASTAEAAGPGLSAGVDHRVWNGYAHILLAEVHANRREVFAAARKAKEGYRLLSDVLSADPDSPEPCFGLGTYNYYADQLSALAKGLRFLLGLPSGDRETGLAQLEFAADRSDTFGLESRLLLATIYAGRRERDYHSSMRELKRALQPSGGPVVALDAASRLDLALGESARAVERIDEALKRVTESASADPTVVAAIRLNRARADYSAFRLDAALERARSLLASTGPIPDRIQRDAQSLVDSCLRLTGRPTGSTSTNPRRGDPVNHGLQPELWARLRAALEAEHASGASSSLPVLRSLSQEMPANPAVALFLGRALLGSGNAPDALPSLERAARSAELPREWMGPAQLFAGQAADLLGDRPRAIGHYREAAKAPPFVESAAPYFYQRTPFTAPVAPQGRIPGSVREAASGG